MARTAPAPNIPPISGMCPSILVAAAREGAAEVLTTAPASFAAGLVDALAEMVRIELPRARRFGAPAFRYQWLEALAAYSSPKTKSVLVESVKAKEPRERIAATDGLLRLGDERALPQLRALLESEPFDLAREATWQAHLALGVPIAGDEQAIEKLIRWWDSHPAEVKQRLASGRKKKPKRPKERPS